MAVAAAPAAISTMTAISTAVSVAATIQAQRQASARASAMKAAQAEKNEQIVESTVANYDQMSEQELSVQEQSLQESLQTQKDYIASKGRVNVMSAAMGTGGQSVASQLQDLERVRYGNYSSILQDKQAQLDNIADSAENERYQGAAAQDRTAITRPSTASTLLAVGSTAAQGYSNYLSTGV
ncbi:internal virion protein [Marinomonas phage CB5A]|uniref:Uncharacterized protein n=1 Tax=Marinomonas phage CB5A TaxID=2022859 RepID=A0A222G3A6_9CAUD|nr:internal virion protein [Marinomonas phage CB5A]ASP46269.1 hypothetical protein [Marinomonas phage CB5A]